ncbi:hypothetical protein KR054_009130 [Drosophila jambulina]|nr:hypothetical protein KR054_009130 [Drosophila jambulina]
MLGIKLALFQLFYRGALSALEGDPELNPGYFQGDIVHRGAQARNGIGNEIFHWPNATVFYFIDPGVFDEAHMEHIYEAMRTIVNNSCITFELAKEEELPFALNITGREPGCSTEVVGFRTAWRNGINLEPYPIGEGCFRIGSIIHELLHVLGFEHQHVAQHRDKYVRILWENIEKEYFPNFVNYDDTTHWVDFGESYDYDSVMHYLPTAFSKNGEPTIVSLKNGNHRMGQRLKMSKSDIRKLNKMYKCHGYI